jgi:hypothetical protein
MGTHNILALLPMVNHCEKIQSEFQYFPISQWAGLAPVIHFVQNDPGA